MAKTTGKGTYLAAALLLLGGLGYLIFSGVDSGSVYFLNVSEAMAMDRAVQFVSLGIRATFGHGMPTREGIALERVLPVLQAPMQESHYTPLELEL